MKINLLQPKGYLYYSRNEWSSMFTLKQGHFGWCELIVKYGNYTRVVLKKVAKEVVN